MKFESGKSYLAYISYYYDRNKDDNYDKVYAVDGKDQEPKGMLPVILQKVPKIYKFTDDLKKCVYKDKYDNEKCFEVAKPPKECAILTNLKTSKQVNGCVYPEWCGNEASQDKKGNKIIF